MKTIDLGQERINKLILNFSIPCIISMLMNSIYNIVDQIFIGQGVGTIGNAATNVIFPLIIICNSIAGLIGNGCSAEVSLKLGEGKKDEAKKSIGASVVLLFISSIIILILGEVFLPILVNLFGCSPNVYKSAIDYGRIILIGAPFMIIYSGLSSIIRADGSPKYSMFCLLIGAIINLILDPIFILVLNMGVKGGALATIIGQLVSFIIAILYLRKIKSVKVTLKDYKLDKRVLKTLSLGLSSFITQMTILVLFVVINNLMTKYGALSKFGSDIPLSVYGIISKINSIYVSCILGISIGSQPIIGYNYGAGNYKRVKETLRKVLSISLLIGIIFNLIIVLFSKEVVSLFITSSDSNYHLFMTFAIDFCHIFLAICFLNAFEMCTSIVVQSLGNVKKATLVSFTRQIVLFTPLALILSSIYGLYGSLYAGVIADGICFFVVLFIFSSEYRKLGRMEKNNTITETKIIDNKNKPKPKCNVVITISREYASGGRYVGKLLAERLNLPLYDKELINLATRESGLSKDYISKTEEKIDTNIIKNPYYSNDDKIFIAESKIIKKIAKEPCLIVGRCADYILKDHKNKISIFLYTSEDDKLKRAIKYYNLPSLTAKKTIDRINKARMKHYKYYTNREWKDFNNYDFAINVASLGPEKTAELLEEIILKKLS